MSVRKKLVAIAAVAGLAAVLTVYLYRRHINTRLPDAWMIDLSEWEGIAAEEAFRRRRERIRRVCQRLREENEADGDKGGQNHFWPVDNGPNAFFVVEKYKLGFCENAKVGCSTWKHHLLHLAGLRPEELAAALHNVHPMSARLFSPFHGETTLQNFPAKAERQGYLLFSVVRHPFERLVSAYEDKVLDHGPGTEQFFKMLVRRIGNSFGAFVDFVLADAAAKQCRLGHCGVDHHWRPYYVRCGYCAVNYTLISHMETFERDAKFILESVGADPGLAVHRRHETTTDNTGRDSRERTRRYFKELSPTAWRDLLKMYQLDFDMFGYDPGDYMHS